MAIGATRSRLFRATFSLGALLTASAPFERAAAQVEPSPREEASAQPEETPDPLLLLQSSGWGAGEGDRYRKLNRQWSVPKPEARSGRMMIVGTSGAFAVRAGLEAMRQGGSATDAVLTTALAQIALDVGCWNSYAGILSLVHFEAETGNVSSLDAGFQIPRGETAPLSIPPRPVPSGRTALVPGFMAGVEAAHRRFGRLPFASLFGPAIEIAEVGFRVGPVLGGLLKSKEPLLRKRGGSRRVFVQGRRIPGVGEVFRQRDLAQTLRSVARDGASFFYTGAWAEAFVREVAGAGGTITAEDMKDYQVNWPPPLSTNYRDYEVFGPGDPSLGGIHIVEALNLVELAGNRFEDPFTETPEGLYWLIQIARIGPLLSHSPPAYLEYFFPGEQFAASDRVSKTHARRVWAKLTQPGWIQKFQGNEEEDEAEEGGGHSDGIVAVDADGNVAVLTHTINTTAWGSTGLFVNGVSIPDSASFQQRKIAAVGPGGRLPNEMVPLVVLKKGKPVLGSSAIGSGLHEISLQCLVKVLDLGQGPLASLGTPTFLGIATSVGPGGKADFRSQAVVEGAFDAELIEEVRRRGQPLLECTVLESRAYRGYWVGVTFEEGSSMRGALSSDLNGYALGE